MDWFTKALDEETETMWYICKHCRAAGANSTRAISHHEHCVVDPYADEHRNYHARVHVGPYGENILDF